MKNFILALRTFFRLALPYFRSQDRWRACGLLAGVIGSELFVVYVAVKMNQWNAGFFNAVEARNGEARARRAHRVRVHHHRGDPLRHGAILVRPDADHPLARMDDAALCRAVDGGRPPLPHPLRRSDRGQHPSADRQRRAVVHPAHPRARHRISAEHRLAPFLRLYPVGHIPDRAAAAARRRFGVPGLSGRARDRLRGARHAGRPFHRLAAHSAAIPPAALRVRLPFCARAGDRLCRLRRVDGRRSGGARRAAPALQRAGAQLGRAGQSAESIERVHLRLLPRLDGRSRR